MPGRILFLIIAAVFVGCGATNSTTEPVNSVKTSAKPKTAPEVKTQPVKKQTIEYAENWHRAADGVIISYERRFDVPLQNDVVSNIVDGKKALELLRNERGHDFGQASEINGFISRLLSTEGSKAYHVVLPDHPSLPESILFVPYPTFGFSEAPPKQYAGPGFLFVFGVETAQNKGCGKCKQFATIASGARVLFYGSDDCPITRHVAELLIKKKVDKKRVLYIDGFKKGSGLEFHSPVYAVPVLVAVDESGSRTDVHVGGNNVEPFLIRHGLTNGNTTLSSKYRAIDARKRVRSIGFAGYVQNEDLSNLNLDGLTMRKGSLSGSDLSGSSLKGANLHKTVLSYANFKGADLTGATVTEVFVKNTICPDGTESDTCDWESAGANVTKPR